MTTRRRWGGGFDGNKTSTPVSTAIFQVCFSCTVCEGLGSTCCEFKKCSSDSIGLWQRGRFQCEFTAANCLSVWQILQKGRGAAYWFSSEIIKQVINFHAENTDSAVSWEEPDNSLLNAQLHFKSFPRVSLPAMIPKSSDIIAAQSLVSQKSSEFLDQGC